MERPGHQSAATSCIAIERGAKTKTDQRDSFYIAELVRIGRARANYVPDDLILQLRQLTRFRCDLVDQLGDVKRHLLAVLDRVFPELAEQFTDRFGTIACALLAEATTAAEFAAGSDSLRDNTPVRTDVDR